VAERFLERLSDGTYRLGTRVLELYGLYHRGSSVTAEFAVICDELSPEATVVLAVLNGTDVVYVACRPGSDELSLHYRIGLRLPASSTASGKAILSTLETHRLRALYGGKALPRPTERSPRTIADLIADLAIARRRGYAIDDEETRPGFLGVGAPVFAPLQVEAIAAVSYSVVKRVGTLDSSALGEQANRFACRLSERLGDARRPSISSATAIAP
jgi:DNA-binding IclR family transcriptional regulator